MPSDAKTCNALTTYYVSAYKVKYKEIPLVNRNKARWSFANILEDYTVKQIEELIDFYFETVPPHDLVWFFNNYDSLVLSMRQTKAYEVYKAKLREETQKRVEEHKQRKERIAQSRSGSDSQHMQD